MKGQVFSVDSLFAFSVFLIVLGLLAYVWMTISFMPSFEMQEKANEIADFLVLKKIATDNVVNCSNLLEFTLEEYEDLKNQFNIGPYDFLVEIEGMDAYSCPDVRPELDIMLVLDVSGSMDDEINDLKAAASAFIQQLNESYDQAGLVRYSSSASVDYELLNMTSANKTIINGTACIAGCDPPEGCGNGINSLCCRVSWSFACWGQRKYCNDCSGGTNIGDGIYEAIDELDIGRPFPPVFKIQVLLSDGNPTYPFGSGGTTDPEDIQYSLDAAHQACLEDNVIYTITLGGDANRTLMQEIAKKTYGKEYYAPNSDDLEEIFLNISSEIAVKENYGKLISANVNNIATVTRYVMKFDKIIKVTVRIFESSEKYVKVCE